MINVGGEKVYPRDVEEVLHRHPAVADAVVVGRPRPRPGRGGQGVPRRSSPASLDRRRGDRLPPALARLVQAAPRVEFVDAVPRSPSASAPAAPPRLRGGLIGGRVGRDFEEGVTSDGCCECPGETPISAWADDAGNVAIIQAERTKGFIRSGPDPPVARRKAARASGTCRYPE